MVFWHFGLASRVSPGGPCYNRPMEPCIPLPVDDFRHEIERAVERHPVIVLTAETGAGKSTRVPGWFWRRGRRVHVTQPRRIAARSLSHYLAGVGRVSWGEEIGYQTGFESRRGPGTRLLYLTDGVQMVQEIRGSRDYDLLVLDEIHEWNLNQEVLVGMVRRNLRNGLLRRSGKRVVIMSATVKARQLASFLDDAPVISIPGRTFPVSRHERSPLFMLPDTAALVEEGHNVLVFQPGKQEIEAFIRELGRLLEHEKRRAVLLPLHSELSIREQSRVFQNYPLPKVVVATDIAQTSLTIDDIDAVIDCGVKKELRVVSGIEGLYPTDISTSECQQRAGRAGRLKPGSYTLYSERSVRDRPEFPEPEIRRLSLETIVLRMCNWGLDPLAFSFFHRPQKNLLLAARRSLQTFGALTASGEVSADGKRMAELPVSVRSARLLIEAEKGGARVTDRALRAIAILECKGILGRDVVNEKYGRSPYQSDLLNQLEMWEDLRSSRGLLAQKKLAQAGEIYAELKRRLGTSGPAARGGGAADDRHLFRAILSAFADGAYLRGEQVYWREGEERQIERSSLLARLKPEMVAGLPFDLVVQRDPLRTGESENTQLPLLTFCSELSLPQLEELKPFSYEKKTEVQLDGNRLRLFERIGFGSRLLKEIDRPPSWENDAEARLVAKRALEWLDANLQRLPLAERFDRLRGWFEEAVPLLPRHPGPFKPRLDACLEREIRRTLRVDDLELYFTFHASFARLTLRQILPYPSIRHLRRLRWPARASTGAGELPLRHIGLRPFVEMDSRQFVAFGEIDALLPTGDAAGIILDGRRRESYAEALSAYNDELRRQIFARRWQMERKPVSAAEIQGIPFPLAFEGGSGKGQAHFEYYSCPEVAGDGIHLVHFLERPEAESRWQEMQPRIEELLRKSRSRQIEELFRQKGWKIR